MLSLTCDMRLYLSHLRIDSDMTPDWLFRCGEGKKANGLAGKRRHAAVWQMLRRDKRSALSFPKRQF